MSVKNLFIVNPKAGKGKRAKDFAFLIENYCRSTNTDYEIYITKKQYDAIDFLKNRLSNNESVRVYACGGDGTLFEVVNGAYGFENVQVGVFPLGSGNDFVRLFTDKENFLNFERQLSGTAVSLDLIKCKNQYAINQCSMGIDAEVCAGQVGFKKLPLVSGEFAFALSAVYCLMKKTDNTFCVSVDGGEPTREKLLFCLAANSRWYGGGYMGAPCALPDDGYIDLVTVRSAGNRLSLLRLLPVYKRGEHTALPITAIRRCKRVQIYADKTAAVNVDGECHFAQKAEFEIADKKINFIVPKGSFMKAPGE